MTVPLSLLKKTVKENIFSNRFSPVFHSYTPEKRETDAFRGYRNGTLG